MSIVVSDRFAEEVRGALEQLIAERNKRLVRETTERNAGFIQGVEAALEVVGEAYRKLNER